jgi:acetate kinase
MLGRSPEDLRLITCHLGNGASITAVKNGRSMDTSMGFTPLEGLMMGTRSGDLDPAIVMFLMEREGLSLQEVNDVLNKKSGCLGLSGLSNDVRDLRAAAANGHERAKITLKVYPYRAKKLIGAYAAAMGGVDAIVFTAGIGENDSQMRTDVCAGLEFLGIEIDPNKNEATAGEARDISTETAKSQVLVIPTNEELMIASETRRIVEAKLSEAGLGIGP